MSLRAHDALAARGESSEVDGSPSVSSQDEAFSTGQVRDQMPQVQEVLKAIFEYYNVSSGSGSHAYQALEEGSLTSMRFQRMALDANLIDEKLTSAKVDLTFHRVCGGSPHMNSRQFLDAVVRLAATKYPELPRNEGVLCMYNAHFASFSAGSAGTFSDLDDEMLAVSAAARPALQTLYEGYFETECRQLMPQRRGSALQSETQGSFVQMLSDFEVLPELVPKSIAFAVFREVVKVREVPAAVRDGLLGNHDTVPPGKKFTYMHFALALMLMARRCFPDEGKTALLRLFEWMDASKGRTHFASRHPGHLSGGMTNFRIRLLPNPRSPDSQEVNNVRRRSTSGASSGATPVRRNSVAGVLSNSRYHSEEQSAAVSESAGPVDELSMAVSPSDRAHNGVTNPCATSESRRLLRQIFGHYAALGDPLNRTHLSTLKFVRLLRDCGLVPSDSAQGRERSSPDFEFAPAQRIQQRSNSVSRCSFGARPAGMGGRSGSTTNLRRNSATSSSSVRGRDGQRESAAAFSVSSAKRAEGNDERLELPLRIFEVPPLTQVDADLMFLHATRVLNGTRSAEGRGSRGRNAGSGSSAAGRRGGRGTVTVKRHHMTVDSFLRGLSFVAARCYPQHAGDGEALEIFCREVLGPLTDALGELKGQDVQSAASVMAEPETVRLLERCDPGLQKIYAQYAMEHAGRRASWNSDAMSRFADDFDLLSEISQLPMQKIFRDCMHWETCCGSSGVDGEMSFVGFQLALVTIAQKIHNIAGTDSAKPLDQITSLLCRMNTAASSANFAGCSSRSEPLIPGLPASSSIPMRRTSSAGGTWRTEKAMHREGEMSWAEMLAT